MKQQFLNSSTARKIVKDLSEISLVKESGKNVDNFGNKISELARKTEGSGSYPPELYVLVAKAFFNCTVEEFKIQALSVFNDIGTDLSSISWQNIVSQLKSKYNVLVALNMWYPAKGKKLNRDNEMIALTATVNKLVNKFDQFEVNKSKNNSQNINIENNNRNTSTN